MVRPDPSLGSKYDAVFDHATLKKPEAVSAPPTKRPLLSLLNVSLTVVIVAVLAVWLRPGWLPPPQETAVVTNPFQNVFDWVLKNGAEIGNINVIGFDGYYELVASKHIEEGERLLTVPISQILDENMILADDIVQSVSELTDSLDESGAAVVFLLANQDKWGVYLDMIQQLDVPSPMFWSEDDIELLKSSMINNMIGELTSILSEQYATIEQFFTGLTFEEYSRLWVNVNSRMWQLQKSETESINALMPVFDFATHSTEANVEIGYEPELDAVVMTSTVELNPSESLHNFYYNTSNIHHLLFQGFTIEENDDHLACEIELGESRCPVDSNMRTSVSDTLVKCVKALDDGSTVKDLWVKVSEFATAALSEFPNTLSEDDALLQTELAPVLHNAVQARRSEKICLNQVKSFSDLMTAAVTTNSWDGVDVAVAESQDAKDYVESLKADQRSLNREPNKLVNKI